MTWFVKTRVVWLETLFYLLVWICVPVKCVFLLPMFCWGTSNNMTSCHYYCYFEWISCWSSHVCVYDRNIRLQSPVTVTELSRDSWGSSGTPRPREVVLRDDCVLCFKRWDERWRWWKGKMTNMRRYMSYTPYSLTTRVWEGSNNFASVIHSLPGNSFLFVL